MRVNTGLLSEGMKARLESGIAEHLLLRTIALSRSANLSNNMPLSFPASL